MKKLTLLFLTLFGFTQAKSQVSDHFYNNFKEMVQKNYDEEQDDYTALHDALNTCFDLRNDKYYAEIKSYIQKGFSDSAAVNLIPREVMNRFLEQDYEKMLCPNADKAHAFLSLYTQRLCQLFTPKYEALSERARTQSKAVLFSESFKELGNDLDFKQKIREILADIDAGVLEKIENEIPPYFNLHCPALKEDLLEMPSLIERNNLRSFVRDQRFDISNKFKYAIENNTPDTLGKIFLNRNDFEAFLKMITSGKVK